MSTAVLISGQMRSFSQTHPLMRWQVFRHYQDLHFFVLVHRNQQAKDIELLELDYPGRVHSLVIDDPVLTVTENISRQWHFAPFANAASPAQLLMQHWYQESVWDWFKQVRGSNNYDTIIRIRADLLIHNFTPQWAESNECITPYWGRFGGVNDRLAVMGPQAAQNYFTTYSKIDRLLAMGCPFHPESLVAASMEIDGTRILPTLDTTFSTLRLPRFNEQTQRMEQQVRGPEITADDMASYAVHLLRQRRVGA